VKTEEKAGNPFGGPLLWERVEVACGEVLCRPGEPADALYLVRSGRVELWHGDGRDRGNGNGNGNGDGNGDGNGSGGAPGAGPFPGRGRRRVVGPGEFFGEVDLGHTSRAGLTYTARALEDSTLLRIDGRGLLQRLRQRRGREGEPLRLKRLLGCGDRLLFLC